LRNTPVSERPAGADPAAERVPIPARVPIIPLNQLVTYGGFCEVDNTHFPITQNLNARRLP
jgi:hypothetical protein